MGTVLNLASGGGGVKADKLRPVGSIYQSVVDTDPGQLFGGVWDRYGAGRVAVGVDANDADFAKVGATGGEKNHLLTAAEMAAHNHVLNLNAATVPSAGYHTHSVHATLQQPGGSGPFLISNGGQYAGYLESAGAHAHAVVPAGAIGNAGGGGAHNNLMPYLTVYAWKRVA